MARPEMSPDGRTLTVHVPFAFRKRGGRKLVIAPQGAEAWAPPRPRADSAMVKALARAFRWRKLLETGSHTSVAEIAAAEKINASYIGRVLRADPALAGDRRGDPGREAAGGSTARRLPEAVSSRVEGAASRDLGHFSLTGSRAGSPAVRDANRLGAGKAQRLAGAKAIFPG
jgi:hypothetical protein